jgi:hypothetical protein
LVAVCGAVLLFIPVVFLSDAQSLWLVTHWQFVGFHSFRWHFLTIGCIAVSTRLQLAARSVPFAPPPRSAPSFSAEYFKE